MMSAMSGISITFFRGFAGSPGQEYAGKDIDGRSLTRLGIGRREARRFASRRNDLILCFALTGLSKDHTLIRKRNTVWRKVVFIMERFLRVNTIQTKKRKLTD